MALRACDKIIEVKHFTQSEGLGLSQEFVNSFYDGLRERLAKGLRRRGSLAIILSNILFLLANQETKRF
jgi:hypothetical protein